MMSHPMSVRKQWKIPKYVESTLSYPCIYDTLNEHELNLMLPKKQFFLFIGIT